MKQNGVMTNPDDIFFYFEMIKNVEPGSILDVGMCLKRMGAVSRQAMSHEIPRETQLDGIDFFPEQQMKVYKKVYDKIWTVEEFIESFSKQSNQDAKKQGMTQTEKLPQYVLAILLQMPKESQKQKEVEQIWDFALWNTGAIMTDAKSAQEQVQQGKIKAYYQVAAGNGQYAWIPTAELRKDV